MHCDWIKILLKLINEYTRISKIKIVKYQLKLQKNEKIQ